MGKNKICCERCEHYCRVVDRKGRTKGYVCNLWLDGMAGDSSWFFPDESCFEKRTRKTTKTRIRGTIFVV